MDQVFRSSQAELSILGVVARVSQVIRVAELNKSGVFDPTILFVVGFRREHGFRTPREVNAVSTLGVTESRRAVCVLRTIQHNSFAIVHHNCGIERAGRLPAGALRRDDWHLRSAMPWPE